MSDEDKDCYKTHKASDARACPFCSCLYTVATSSIIEDGSELYFIQCWNCGGSGPATATYIDTLNAWNGQTIEMVIERGRKISREQLDKEK